jgi:hypothetical protein
VTVCSLVIILVITTVFPDFINLPLTEGHVRFHDEPGLDHVNALTAPKTLVAALRLVIAACISERLILP